jgi:flotillin
MFDFPSVFTIAMALVILVVLTTILAIMFRQVVSTNTVHIVQSRRKTTSYGTGQTAGNVYYKWPSWVPYFGITVIKLPVSNFDLSLAGYEAYDRDRVPFVVDVVAFFRINDTANAAQRVATIDELKDQLKQITQGAVRKVLASDHIDTIMVERAKFGKQFTDEVLEQLKQWGVEPVKTMELMDIRDQKESKVIHNIMAKKMSHIEMESRTEVAKNMQVAKTAEITATQAVDIRAQEAAQAVGERTAEKEKAVGIATQQSRQEVLTQEKETKTRDMAVHQVAQVREAEIEKEKQIVAAEQDKQTNIIKAEGHLEAERRRAQGIEAVGTAEGAAETAKLMAPVTAQIKLAETIAEKPAYQNYLVTIEAVKAHIAVGTAQAEALKHADVKVIANTGTPVDGVRSAMDLFSTKGGTALGGMVEAMAQTPTGKAILAQIGVNAPEVKAVPAAPMSGNGLDHSAKA